MPAEPLGPHDWDAELRAAMASMTRARVRKRRRDAAEAVLWGVGTVVLGLAFAWACLVGF